MNIRPLYDRLVIKRQEEEVTAGGIVIPDTAKEKPMRGKIIAAGEGKLLENGQLRPLGVKVGQVVLYGKYAGTEFKVNGDEYLVLREDDIIGIIE